MAISTSTAETTPAGPEPRHQMLETIREQIAAIDELVALATESIRVFDIDLAQTGWNSVVRNDRLGAFLRRSRQARLEIIVHDTRWLEGSGARLLALMKTFSFGITVYTTGAEAKGAMDPLVIVDGRHFLHRFHIEQPRAAFGIEQPQEAQPLINRFAEIWATGEPGMTATVLGL
jgi:hypothetical protein